MAVQRYNRCGGGWLEVLLMFAVLAFLFQAFPSLWSAFKDASDVWNWSPRVWLSLNIGFLLLLLGIRSKSELKPSVVAFLSWIRQSHSVHRPSQGVIGGDADYEARARRDADWRERAKNRLPFT
jgi:hypothetical protein